MSRTPGRWRLAPAALVALACVLLLTGCAVPQPRGAGRLERIVEPTTRRGYWLYLPEAYTRADQAELVQRRWPLVVTFHGMKPFDISYYQAREWEQEADRYGFVVVAPELGAPDVLAEFPLRTVHPAFKRDEQAVLAILDHVFATTRADPSNVLATSWSSGGYTAHYMLNRHPDRFTALAVRQSNFSSSVLDPRLVARSVNHPVLIINTQNDIGICRKESKQALQWYESHGYRYTAWVLIRDLGHERTPDLAADFFGRIARVQPGGPSTALAWRQAIDGNAEGLALLSGDYSPALARVGDPRSTRPATPTRPTSVASSQAERRPGDAAARAQRPQRDPVSISVSPRTGIAPLYFSFSADCPTDWHRTASFLWTLNGEPIAWQVNGQSSLSTAGDHTLALRVVTASGQEHVQSQTIRVIPRMSGAALSVP